MQTEANKPERPSCPKCGNRLRVLPDQVGTAVRCPKCNAKFVIGGRPKPSKPKPAAPPGRPSAEPASTAPAATSAEEHFDDSYLPEIPQKRSTIVPEETSHLPGEQPQIVPQEPATLGEPTAPVLPEQDVTGESPYAAEQTEYEVDWSTLDAAAEDAIEPEAAAPLNVSAEQEYLESARARGLVREVSVAKPPRWTFFTGVFSYPWRGVNLSRWTAMSFGLSVAGWASLRTLEYLGLMDGLLTNLAVQGVVLAMFTIIILLAVLSFAAASCQAAIQDTSDGHDLPQEASLPEWDHWVFTFLAWFSLAAGAAALGFPLSLAIGPAAFLIAGALLFPILLLSAMEADSFFVPYSPAVLRTLGEFWQGWLMFYLLTTGMFALWVVGFDLAATQAPYLTVVLSGPVLAAMMLIYARLLGRLAWRASGAPIVVVEEEQPLQTARAKDKTDAAAEPAKKRRGAKAKKRRFKQIEIPTEVDTPHEPDESPRQRINFHLRP